MQQIKLFLENNLTGLHMPNIRLTDIVEILIIAFLVYQIFAWARNTRLMSLLKGIVVILVFIMLAAIFNMSTILWIVSHILSIAVIAVVVVLQPELRKALEGVKLGAPDSCEGKLRPILQNPVLFGVDLYEAGLGDKVEQLVRRELAGPGAVRETLKSCL